MSLLLTCNQMWKSSFTFSQHHIFDWWISAVVQGDTPEDIYVKVKEVIQEQAGPTIWVPSKDQLWRGASPSPWTLPARHAHWTDRAAPHKVFSLTFPWQPSWKECQNLKIFCKSKQVWASCRLSGRFVRPNIKVREEGEWLLRLAKQGVEEENQITPKSRWLPPQSLLVFDNVHLTLVELIFRVDLKQTAVIMLLKKNFQTFVCPPTAPELFFAFFFLTETL